MAIAVNAANTADTSHILRRVYVHQLYTEIDLSAALLLYCLDGGQFRKTTELSPALRAATSTGTAK